MLCNGMSMFTNHGKNCQDWHRVCPALTSWATLSFYFTCPTKRFVVVLYAMFHLLIVILILIQALAGREKILPFGKNPPRSKGAQAVWEDAEGWVLRNKKSGGFC